MPSAPEPKKLPGNWVTRFFHQMLDTIKLRYTKIKLKSRMLVIYVTWITTNTAKSIWNWLKKKGKCMRPGTGPTSPGAGAD